MDESHVPGTAEKYARTYHIVLYVPCYAGLVVKNDAECGSVDYSFFSQNLSVGLSVTKKNEK